LTVVGLVNELFTGSGDIQAFNAFVFNNKLTQAYCRNNVNYYRTVGIAADGTIL